MYIMCKKYKLQVSESSFSKTLKITFRTEGYFSTLAKFIPICNGNFFMWLQILPFERVWNPEITITYWNASFGGTFSPSYSSSFWFDPLLPRIQLTCLSLNCLYLFSPGYSSFRMVCTYSHPDTFIQLSYPFLMGSLIQVDNYVPLNFQIQKAKKYSQN